MRYFRTQNTVCIGQPLFNYIINYKSVTHVSHHTPLTNTNIRIVYSNDYYRNLGYLSLNQLSPDFRVCHWSLVTQSNKIRIFYRSQPNHWEQYFMTAHSMYLTGSKTHMPDHTDCPDPMLKRNWIVFWRLKTFSHNGIYKCTCVRGL